MRAKPNKITALKTHSAIQIESKNIFLACLRCTKHQVPPGFQTQVSGIGIRFDNQLHYGTLVLFAHLCIASEWCPTIWRREGKNTKDTVLKKVFQGALSHIRAKPNKITAVKTLSAIPIESKNIFLACLEMSKTQVPPGFKQRLAESESAVITNYTMEPWWVLGSDQKPYRCEAVNRKIRRGIAWEWHPTKSQQEGKKYKRHRLNKSVAGDAFAYSCQT